MKFIVKLKAVHEASGYSRYRVAKDTGLSLNTVKKYLAEETVECGYLPMQVIQMANFYGVDWRDPAVVELIEEETEENQDALLATA